VFGIVAICSDYRAFGPTATLFEPIGDARLDPRIFVPISLVLARNRDISRAAFLGVERDALARDSLAGVAELVDAAVLGAAAERLGGSSPFTRTTRPLQAATI
jgi:hypothetical protein